MKLTCLMVTFFLLASFMNAPSSKEDNNTEWRSTKTFSRNIVVTNVEELYKAVNGPNDDGKGNEGAHIFLQPGEYILTAFTSRAGKTIGRPNMGRLEFQKDMKITGDFEKKVNNSNKKGPSAGSKSIINGSQLPKESFSRNEGDNEPKRTGFIRMGKGDNLLAHVTVIGNTLVNPDGNAVALSCIDTDLCDVQVINSTENVYKCGDAIVRIEHNLIMDGQTGIDIRNAGISNLNRKLTAFITDNEIRNMKTAAGQGITIQNSVNVNGASINADLRENVLHFNNVGLRVMNQHANSGKIVVTSHDDWFEDNAGNGILIYGGMDINPATPASTANNNSIRFEGHNNHIKNNKGNTILYADPGGVFICGGFTAKVSGRTSDNSVEFNLFKPEFSNNTDKSNVAIDVNAFGARSDAGAGAGSSNIVNILIQGATPIVKTTTNDHPATPETNMVNKKIQ